MISLRDPALPGLALALAPEKLGLPCATLTKIRHKPGERCLLLFEASRGEGCRPLYYVKVVTPARARVAARKHETRPDRAAGDVATSFDRRDEGVLVFGFPNDARLRSLPHLVDAKRLKRDVMKACPELLDGRFRVSGKRSRIDLVRYKPERRAVARLDLALVDDRSGDARAIVLYGKQDADRSARERAERLHAVRRAASGFTVPEVKGWSESTGTLFVAEGRGKSLRECLRSRGFRGAWRAAGRALRALHESRLSFPTEIGARAIRRALAEASRGLVHHLPGDHERIVALEERIAGLIADPSRLVPVHGDFHDRQVLVCDEVVTFVDLDDAAMSDAGDDLASALAHVDLLRIRHAVDDAVAEAAEAALVDGYGARPSPVKLAAARFRLAESGFRDADDRATEIARAMLEQAEACITRSVRHG